MRVSGHKSLAALQEYLGVDRSAVNEKLAAQLLNSTQPDITQIDVTQMDLFEQS